MKRANLEIIYPKTFTIDERIDWHKSHSELKEIEFSKQSMARFRKIRAALDSIGWQLMRCFEDAEKETWTHEKQLNYLTEWLFNTAKFRKLPKWARDEIDGMLWVLRKQQDRKLVWTHVIDGVRVKSGSPECEGKYQTINDKESKHCWINSAGEFVPFN